MTCGCRLAAGLLLGAALACGGGAPELAASREFGVQVVDSQSVLDFHSRASAFYERLAQRRFNTRATYRDARLREYFRDERAYADYYADLAQALVDADFEKNRPLSLDVVEFFFDGPGLARVRVRIRGDDSRPLRVGEVTVEREDRWERVEGAWWIVPGRL